MTTYKLPLIGLMTATMLLAGCARQGEIDITSGVGITMNRSGCPAVAVPDGTGDITLFNPASSMDASALDVTATMTNVRPSCNDTGEKIYAEASFDVLGHRTDTRGARSVTLPYYAVVTQAGDNVVSKRVGQVTLQFADGQARASASGRAGAFVDGNLARLPDDIREKITRRRDPGDADAAIDPLSDPAVKAAVARASFELLVGFQLTDDQLRYNVTR